MQTIYRRLKLTLSIWGGDLYGETVDLKTAYSVAKGIWN